MSTIAAVNIGGHYAIASDGFVSDDYGSILARDRLKIYSLSPSIHFGITGHLAGSVVLADNITAAYNSGNYHFTSSDGVKDLLKKAYAQAGFTDLASLYLMRPSNEMPTGQYALFVTPSGIYQATHPTDVIRNHDYCAIGSGDAVAKGALASIRRFLHNLQPSELSRLSEKGFFDSYWCTGGEVQYPELARWAASEAVYLACKHDVHSGGSISSELAVGAGR